MTSPISIATFLIFVLGSACKTIPDKQAQTPAAAPAAAAAEAADEPRPVTPSPALKGTPDLVTPGQDEALIRRGPGARCPSPVDLVALEKTLTSLGQKTIDLVKEDLVVLRQTATRSDRDGIASCCNQMEQLVQDVEIMNDSAEASEITNEDRDSAAASLERIRRLTLALCPPSS